MNELTNLKMTPVNNLRGGKGIILVSDDIEVDDVILSVMEIMPGHSIGMHEHPLDDGITEVYQVVKGSAPLINGVRTKVAVCRPGESHDLVNDTDGCITLLATKSK